MGVNGPKPEVKWRKGYNPDRIIDEIRKSSDSNDAFEMRFWRSTLYTALERTSQSDPRHIADINQALAKLKQATRDDFEKVYLEIKGAKRDAEKWLVAFPIWGQHWYIPQECKIRNCTLRPAHFYDQDISTKVRTERSSILEARGVDRFHRDFIEDDSTPLLLTSVVACSAEEAFEAAYNSATILLAIISLSTNMESRKITLGAPPSPVSKILIAPGMTIHRETGEKVNSTIWTTEWNKLRNEVAPATFPQPKSESRLLKAIDRISKNPWREDAEIALQYSYDSFGSFSPFDTLWSGWRLLEHIGGRQGDKSEKIIKRAAFLSRDPERTEILGRHLLERRNQAIHAFETNTEDGEEIMFQMRDLTFPLSRGFLFNHHNLQTKYEFWDMLDLPHDVEHIQQQISLRETGIKIRRRLTDTVAPRDSA